MAQFRLGEYSIYNQKYTLLLADFIAKAKPAFNRIKPSIKKPTCEEYKITSNDFYEKDKFEKELKEYNRNIDGLSGFDYILLVLIALVYATPFAKEAEEYKFLIFLCGIFCACTIFIFLSFIPLIISLITKPVKRLLYSKPVKPISCDKIERYNQALQEYNNKIDEFDKALRLYEYELQKHRQECSKIDDFNKNILNYCYSDIIGTINRVIWFIDSKNRDIEKRRNYLKKEYWESLDPYEFEEKVAEWFEEQGIDVELTKKSGDGGVDIILTEGSCITYVQCKRFTTNKVSAPIVQQLYGTMQLDGVDSGIIVCLLGVTNEAQKLIDKAGIEVITLDDLTEPIGLRHTYALNSKLISKINSQLLSVGDFFLSTRVFMNKDIAERELNMIDKNAYPYSFVYKSSYCYQIIMGKRIEFIKEFREFYIS